MIFLGSRWIMLEDSTLYIFPRQYSHFGFLFHSKSKQKNLRGLQVFFIANKETCGKFGNVDIITGKYTFDDANKVREDESKCGEYAIFYKENRFKFITRPYYYIQDNWRYLPFLIISISAFGAYATIAILSLIRMFN